VSQLPQWLAELLVSTHALPHIVSEPVHTQLPALHAIPAPQALPHAPQFALLLIVSTHAPLQFVGGSTQLVVHAPF
jgi:hypothetical protein